MLEQIITGGIVALATAYATSRFYFHKAQADLQKEYESRFNQKKWDAYSQFSSTVRDMLKAQKAGTLKRDTSKFVSRLYDFIGQLWLVGSDDVIEAVLEWRRTAHAGQNGKPSPNLLEDLTGIIVAMRADLGERKTSVDSKQLLATFVDEYL